jgi:hypothetical protein
MRISRKVRKDFEFYTECYNTFSGAGWIPPVRVVCDPDGRTALEAFALLDSRGVTTETREPGRLRRTLAGKALINWHITNWAEGIRGGLFCLGEFQEEFSHLPERVWGAVRAQRQSAGMYDGFGWAHRRVSCST